MKNTLRFLAFVIAAMLTLVAFTACAPQEKLTDAQYLSKALANTFATETSGKDSFTDKFKNGSVQIKINDLDLGEGASVSADGKVYYDIEKKNIAMIGSTVLDDGTDKKTTDREIYINEFKEIIFKSEALLGETVIGMKLDETLAEGADVENDELSELLDQLSAILNRTDYNIDYDKLTSGITSAQEAVIKALDDSKALTRTEADGKVTLSVTFDKETSLELVKDLVADLKDNADVKEAIKQVYNSNVLSGLGAIGGSNIIISDETETELTYEAFESTIWNSVDEAVAELESSDFNGTIEGKFVIDSKTNKVDSIELKVSDDRTTYYSSTMNKDGKTNLFVDTDTVKVNYSGSSDGMTLSCIINTEYDENTSMIWDIRVSDNKDKLEINAAIKVKVQTFEVDVATLSASWNKNTGDVNVSGVMNAGDTATFQLKGNFKIEENKITIKLGNYYTSVKSILGVSEDSTTDLNIEIIITAGAEMPEFPQDYVNINTLSPEDRENLLR